MLVGMESSKDAARITIPIVAIGVAAGGLEALERLFSNIPSDTNMSFVVVSHLDPTHEVLLPELLKAHTRMKVYLLKNEKKLQTNSVYIIPANKSLIFSHGGSLQVLSREELQYTRFPIDDFFYALAEQKERQIICVILTGTGTDGTLGLRAIKDAGGYVIVQTPTSAKYDGMPRSAINTGLADAVLTPEEIPAQLLKYTRQTLLETDKIPDSLQLIFLLLRNRTSHDFSQYKRKTVERRIQKRMSVNQIDTLTDYANFLQQNPSEIDSLFKEFLIGVTQFFRDSEAFEILKQHILTKLYHDKPLYDSFRVWIPGCAKGEEVYSIAILLQECSEELNQPLTIQIFGTDIDATAIDKARTGVYPEDIAARVSSRRLKEFFTKEDGTYSIKKDIRKTVIFACQNIIKDPPFTKLDLICCRNVLIYLDSPLQKKLLPLFHYSLNPNGMLFLGTSETIGGFTDLFNVLDKKWKIFQKKEATLSRQPFITFPIITSGSETTPGSITKESVMSNTELDISHLAEKFLLNNYGPPCVIVNKSGDILYIHGKIGKYLEPVPGKVRFNVLEMAHSDLKTELITALHQASIQQAEIVFSKLQIKNNSDTQTIDLKVRALTEQEAVSGLMLVVFEPSRLSSSDIEDEKKTKSHGKWAKRVEELQKELKNARESLQIAIEEHKASNERLQSINEELQSNNEEIETSKEELQSLNEELVTVNSELQGRIDQLSSANDDMKNLLDSTEIATLFLDNNLCVKRFTPKVTQVINLISLDIGRPLSHFVFNLNYDKLIEDAYEVLKTLNPKDLDVKSKDGYWYCVRIIPYRTVSNMVDGVVITFLNVHEQKQTEEELKCMNILLQNTFAAFRLFWPGKNDS